MPSSGRAPDKTNLSSPSGGDDEDKNIEFWYSYIDEKGDKQGPFPGSYLFAWYQSGLMHKNVLVKEEIRRKIEGNEPSTDALVLYESNFSPFKEFLLLLPLNVNLLTIWVKTNWRADPL